jgi:hypothetical protein
VSPGMGTVLPSLTGGLPGQFHRCQQGRVCGNTMRLESGLHACELALG